MKKLDKIEKKIWKKSRFVKIVKSPDVHNAWSRLEQLMDISSNNLVREQLQFPFSLFPILKWKTNLPKIILIALLALVCFPIGYKLLTTTSVQVKPGSIETLLLSDGSFITLNSLVTDLRSYFKHIDKQGLQGYLSKKIGNMVLSS